METTNYGMISGYKGFGGALRDKALMDMKRQQMEQEALLNQAKILSAQKGGDLPSNVREYEYFNSLPSREAKEQYLQVKRAEKYFDTGSGFARVNPMTNQAFPVMAGGNQGGFQDVGTNNYGMPQPLTKDLSPEKQAVAERKKSLDQNLVANALQANQTQLDLVNNLFDKDGNLKEDAAANYGTILGMRAPVVFQGTADARANLEQVNAKAFVQALGDMKAQSATGASGLGSATEREGDKVQAAALAAADTRQSPESAAKNFLAYKKALEETNARLQSGLYKIYPDLDPNAVTNPNFIDLPNNPNQFSGEAGEPIINPVTRQVGGKTPMKVINGTTYIKINGEWHQK